MSEKSRRQFLKNMAKAAGIGAIAMIPGSIFSAQKTLVKSELKIRTKFATALGKANRRNLKQVLRGSQLSNEEKLAVVALKELNTRELNRVISGRIGHASEAGGDVCGIGCGSNCGGTCGISCSVNPGSEAVINPSGQLGIKLKGFNKAKFRQLLIKGRQVERSFKYQKILK